jgi:D-glycero-D-manno-heptose 1,7-bisphosphate phosphatase
MSDKKRAVFLDRDGVLNDAPVRGGRPYSPRTVADFKILPGVPEALAKLKKAGFLLVVATNQPDVGRGDMAGSELEAMHDAMMAALPIDQIKVCPHDDRDSCLCRKPKPGMLTTAAEEKGIDLSKSYMVGDRWRDVDCGTAAGVTSIFIQRRYEEQQPTAQAYTARDLVEATEWILGQLHLAQ